MSDDPASPRRSADVTVRRSADVPVRPGHGDVPVAIANEKANEKAASDSTLPSHSLADADVRAPGSADVPVRPGHGDVPVAIANEKANEKAASDSTLSPHSLADEDVRAPATPPTREWHTRGYLPHRDRLHLLQSITYRLADSLPQTELKRLEQQLLLVPKVHRGAAKRKQIEALLDAGMGCCALAHPEAAACVRDALLHFDGDRYRVIAWVVMPNHVHVLIDPAQPISKTIQSWKSFTARWLSANNIRLNLGIPDARRVWMPDYWDRFIRDEDHLTAAIDYIHDNPVKARLCSVAADWPWSSAPRSADVPVRPGHGDVPVAIANEKANEQAASDSTLSSHSQADEDVRAPGSADVPVRPGHGDVPVAIANEKANEQAASDSTLSSHSQADEDVRAPGADEDVRAPADEDVRAPTLTRIRALIAGETDAISIMATIACELHHSDPRFDWTGFYRVTEPGLLKIGPYQGGHGCLQIPFSRGVCGRCAREAKTQLVNDVHAVPDHIACSSTTRSEIVVPVFDKHGEVRAVLDIDSNQPAAFTEADAEFLETVCGLLSDFV